MDRFRNFLKPVLSLLFIILPSFTAMSQLWQTDMKDFAWKGLPATAVHSDGNTLTSSGIDFSGWPKATVPGTILTTLLNRHEIPDPFYGFNNEHIPDVYHTGNAYYTWWFVTSFRLPEKGEGRYYWLKFRGVNYAAQIFFNGRRLNSDTHRGMYLRSMFQVIPYTDRQENRLAVLVSPPDPPGNPDGGQGGNGRIGKNVTNQFTAGWDWIQPVRDRNTGIWDKVTLEATGPVIILDPYVVPIVEGIRYPGKKQAPAKLKLQATLFNASDKVQEGIFRVTVGTLPVTKRFRLQPGDSGLMKFTDIILKNPQLWWPNGYGPQHLTTAVFTIRTDDSGLSDRRQVTFGIRSVGSYFNHKTGARVFTINGQKIFINGGNWITGDAMMRMTPEKYDVQVRMHAEMNLNMIRVWGGSLIERPEFYAACDKYGILVWQDLPITGDCNGRWKDPKKADSQARRREYPDEHSLFLATITDQVKMLRNHPSLMIWCGGNEYPPPPDINRILKNQLFPQLDEARIYLEESTGPDVLTNTIGGNGDGPYRIQKPSRFFTFRNYPFNPETGSVGLPVFETLQEIIPEKYLRKPKDIRTPVFRYHKFIGFGNRPALYGRPETMKGFVRLAQIVSYNQYRALIEGYNAHMWNWYTGVLIWKTQNPWSALRGMFYDFMLDQNAGFYGVRHAAENIHIQFNLNDSAVCVVNHTFSPLKNLEASFEAVSLTGRPLMQKSYELHVPPSSATMAGYPAIGKIEEDVYLIKLTLTDKDGIILSRNLYWMKRPGGDYTALSRMPPATLTCRLSRKAKRNHFLATLENTGKIPAFFIRLKVTDGNNKRILPVFYSDNYLTLLPGETQKITLKLPDNQTGSATLEYNGMNLAHTRFVIKQSHK